MASTPDSTDWLSDSDQKLWFEKFSDETTESMRFAHFQDFLRATVYPHFSRISSKSKLKTQESPRFTYQQELQLFKAFDLKNDHSLDIDEFAHMCRSWLHKTFHSASALVIVDVQNDFIDGSLALINGPAGQDGAEVVPVINKLLECFQFAAVVYTQDWHPSNHIGFIDNLHLRKYILKPESSQNETVKNKEQNEKQADEQSDHSDLPSSNNQVKFKLKRLVRKVNVFDSVLFDEGRMEQKLWPIHCVQNTWGAELHPKLKIVPNSIRILKGTLPYVDAYSAFWDNMRLNETSLRQELTSRGISEVFFCGLALDFCVAASAIDSAQAGFITIVIEDACRGIDLAEVSKRKTEMTNHGILFATSDSLSQQLDGGLPLFLLKNICLQRAFKNDKAPTFVTN